MDEELKTADINWDTLENVLHFDVNYDKTSDTLFVQSKEDRPAISIDCDGAYWIRIDPQTGEILGIEIENFKKLFIKKHAKAFNKIDTYARPVADIIQMEKCAV